jgi:UDP-2,3-diacylglucosamine hydrolase
MFIADLHLTAERPDINKIFAKFIKTIATKASRLYILGDLFDYWLGDMHNSFNLTIIASLRRLARHGTAIYYLPGNRDFLVNQQFAQASNCLLLSDHQVILVAGEKILLMHGDLLCTMDTAYLQLRRLMHNGFLQKIFLLLPIAIRQKIALGLRHKSELHTKTSAAAIMDVSQQAVLDIMRQYCVYHLIHGHTHRPANHQFNLDGKIARRTVLAPWHEYGSVLSCTADGSKETITIY